jgi:hypothetical protein
VLLIAGAFIALARARTSVVLRESSAVLGLLANVEALLNPKRSES